MQPQICKNAYLAQIKSIKTKKCSYYTKIKLMEGVLDKLKSLNNNPELMQLPSATKAFVYQTPQPKRKYSMKKHLPSEGQSTSYSFYSDGNSEIYGQNSPQDYEQKIMQKRVIKFQVNQQIEALEDDLFQIEKVIQTKRDFNDVLAKQIQKRMKQIGQNTKAVKEEQTSFFFKSSSKIAKKQDKSFDMMNMTVSGASNFGFVNKSKQQVNASLNTSKHEITINHLNIEPINDQRKKAKSQYLGKSITGIFKNILK